MVTFGKRQAAVGIAVLCSLVAWVSVAVSPGLATFGIMRYAGTSGATAWSFALTIVGYLNSWWGFAAAVATAAVFGLSWTVVLIRAVLQRTGFWFAVQYASWL